MYFGSSSTKRSSGGGSRSRRRGAGARSRSSCRGSRPRGSAGSPRGGGAARSRCASSITEPSPDAPPRSSRSASTARNSTHSSVTPGEGNIPPPSGRTSRRSPRECRPPPRTRRRHGTPRRPPARPPPRSRPRRSPRAGRAPSSCGVLATQKTGGPDAAPQEHAYAALVVTVEEHDAHGVDVPPRHDVAGVHLGRRSIGVDVPEHQSPHPEEPLVAAALCRPVLHHLDAFERDHRKKSSPGTAAISGRPPGSSIERLDPPVDVVVEAGDLRGTRATRRTLSSMSAVSAARRSPSAQASRSPTRRDLHAPVRGTVPKARAATGPGGAPACGRSAAAGSSRSTLPTPGASSSCSPGRRTHPWPADFASSTSVRMRPTTSACRRRAASGSMISAPSGVRTRNGLNEM